MSRRYLDPDVDLDGHGVPWTDEPVPELDSGVAARFSRGRMFSSPRYPGHVQIGPRRVLARHFGAWGRPDDAPEWLPVWVDEVNGWERTTRHPEPERVRSFAGGEGSVRSTTGRMDVFHVRELGPRSPLVLRRGDYPPAGVEGPVELAYFWDGHRAPQRPFGWPVIR